MNPIKISVIVPIYNAEKYIAQCIQSLLAQTLGEIEIIIVNDGSTDNSKSIILQYAANDGRIVFIDGGNEGVSAARNKGIIIAKGEYLGFVDADDYAAENMYQVLFEKAKEGGADVAICNVQLVSENKEGRQRLSLENAVINIEINRNAALTDLMHYKYDHANFNKIYAADIIKQHGLRFNSEMKVHEDFLFNLMYFQYAKKGVSVHDALYNYRQHAASVTSVASHDHITELNILFNSFNDYCAKNGFANSTQCFNTEMRRGFYYSVIPGVFRNINNKPLSFFRKTSLFANELLKINDHIFYFEKAELKGIQGFKKRLLMRKKFLLFSLMLSIKG